MITSSRSHAVILPDDSESSTVGTIKSNSSTQHRVFMVTIAQSRGCTTLCDM